MRKKIQSFNRSKAAKAIHIQFSYSRCDFVTGAFCSHNEKPREYLKKLHKNYQPGNATGWLVHFTGESTGTIGIIIVLITWYDPTLLKQIYFHERTRVAGDANFVRVCNDCCGYIYKELFIWQCFDDLFIINDDLLVNLYKERNKAHI